jgi:hypothetical protein
VASNGNSPDTVRRQIEAEREQLADAVKTLRTELHEATDVAGKLPPLPVLALGALAGGFVLSGGVGAAARMLFRRGREGRERAAIGRYKLVDRD